MKRNKKTQDVSPTTPTKKSQGLSPSSPKKSQGLSPSSPKKSQGLPPSSPKRVNKKQQSPKTSMRSKIWIGFYISLVGISLVLLGFIFLFLTTNGIDNGDTLISKSVYIYYERIMKNSKISYKNVAIGYNMCLDLIVEGVEIMKQLNCKGDKGFLHSNIGNLESLSETFSYSFSNGTAVERFIENDTLCDLLMNIADKLEEKTYFAGGNAFLMGARFAKQGCNVLLGASVGELSKTFFHKNMKIIESETKFKDEIHLIMEFKRNDKWESHVAPRDNRLIVHCDYTNSRLKVLEQFHNELETGKFKPDALVISGIHGLEREEKSFRTKRLKDILSRISNTKIFPYHIPIHIELASLAEVEFSSEIARTFISHFDSVGLNEQELGFLYYSLQDKQNEEELEKVKKTFKDPTVDVVSRALSYVFSEVYKGMLSDHIQQERRRLSRIHFHFLKYHIIAQKIGSGWSDGKTSVIAGTYVASTQSCSFNGTSSEVDSKFMLLFDDNTWGDLIPKQIDKKDPTFHWKDKVVGIEFFMAPMLVCRKPTKTVGLGDAVSSMGLVYHSHHKL